MERGTVRFSVLGPVEVTVDGRSLAMPARARDVLAVLLVHAGRVVPADLLTDELWPGHPAAKAAASLQVRVSHLRKLLAPEDRLTTKAPGYLLDVRPGELDASRFEDLAARGHAALAGRQPREALEHLSDALALWRGDPLAGTDAPSARAQASRLAELRIAALEGRAEALVHCGKLGDAIAELDILTQAHPLRERLWHTRMLALYRCGRQADALRAYREVHAILADELAIEPGPPLRDLHARVLRQDPGLDEAPPPSPGGGSGLAVREEGRPVSYTRYAVTDDGVHIAYQVLGQGARDIVFVPGLMSHLELLWEDDDTAGFFRRLATLGRLILFDKRDTGLSDRAVGDLSLAERMADVRAVMRAAGSSRAVLFGYSEGAPMSMLLAATCPSLVSALILGSASARWFPAPDYPCGGEAEAMFAALREIATTRWGQGDSIDWYLPSHAGSAHARELFARFERLAVNPGAFLRMMAMIRDIDVRWTLPLVRVPTLVLHRLGDRITPPFHGRYLAAHIDGARYFEQPGDHSLRFAGSGDSDALFTEIAAFLGPG